MSNYKLIYFNVRARGETSRMLFALGDVKYEDVRTGGDDWKAMKPNTPFGQLPMLEVDGMKLCQSHAIERLIAKRTGVYGKNDLEQAKADMIADSIEDMFKPLFKIFSEPEEKKAELKANYAKETLPSFFANFEKLLNSDGLFISDKIMWPDVGMYSALENLPGFGVDITAQLDNAPKLKALKAKVGANPKIAKWVKERPVTQM